MLDKISEITSPNTAPFKTFLTVSAMVFLLVFGATAVITCLLPETYASTVRINIEPNAVAPGKQGSPSAVGVYDPYLIQTEFEILQSAATLGEVAERLDLGTKWGGSHKGAEKHTISKTLQLLKGRVEMRSIRNTSLIEIRVFSEDPNEAATIANAIADVYRFNRVEKRRQLVLNGINILEKRFSEHERKIHEAQQEVDRLRKNLGISGSDAAAVSSTPTLEAETIRQLQGQLIAAETALAREETTLKELKKLSAEQRRDAIQTTIGSDNELGALLSEYNLARQRSLALQKDHATEAPIYQSAKTLADEAANRITERVEGMMTGLKARVSIQQAALEKLKAMLERSHLADIEKTERNRPFYEAKLRLDELMRFRSVLDLKLASERLDAALPEVALVEVVDRASPNLQSVRPNKPRNLFLGAIAGFVLGTLIGGAVATGSFWTRRKAPSQAAA